MSVAALTASVHPTELAERAAAVARNLLPASEVVVMLCDPQGGAAIVSRREDGGKVSAGLQQWAAECLQNGGDLGSGAQPYLARAIRSEEGGALKGVVVTERSASDERAAVEALEGVARLAGIRIEQIAEAARGVAATENTRLVLGKGLHDLRTPLNSLRLGLHLLEPALAGRDPALMQRVQRAVDRMAALVSEMFDALNRNMSGDAPGGSSPGSTVSGGAAAGGGTAAGMRAAQ